MSNEPTNRMDEKGLRLTMGDNAKDAALLREALSLYGKVRHEFYVMRFDEEVARCRMDEQWPLLTKAWNEYLLEAWSVDLLNAENLRE